MADPTPGEIWRVLTDVRVGQERTMDGLAALVLAVARLEERFAGHVDAQAQQAAHRDLRCLEHLGLIREAGARVAALESTSSSAVATVVESHRSWGSVVQATASVAALAGVVIALWRG